MVESVWCPSCSAQLPAHAESPVIACPDCGAPVDMAAAVAASRWWARAWDQRQRAGSLQQQAEALQRSAVAAAAAAADADRRWRAAQARARAGAGGASTPPSFAAPAAGAGAGVPVGRSPAPGGPPSAPPIPYPSGAGRTYPAAVPRQRRSIPAAVLLQGTGAVLLLAALMVGSAVLWGSMPPGLQVAVLVALVGASGALTVWATRRLPATGAVLAVLTAAGGVVVASAAAVILPALDGHWYATAASAVGALTMLAAGRAWSVRLWRLAGVLTLGLTVALAVAAAVSATQLEPGSVLWCFALVLLLVPWPAAAIAVSRATSETDPETSRTTMWIGAAALVGLAAALAAGGAAWLLALGEGRLSAGERAASAAALVVTATLVWQLDRARGWAGAGGRIAAVLVSSLPIVLLFPAAAISTAAAVPAGLGAVVVLAGIAVLAARVPQTRPAAALAAAGLGCCAAVSLATVGVFAGDGVGQAWLIALVWGVGAAVVGLWYGLVLRAGGWLWAATAGFAVTWAAVWDGGHLGSSPEALVLPIGGFGLLTWALARRAGLLPVRLADPRVAQVWVLLAATPTMLFNLQAQLGDGPPLWRILLEASMLAAVALWASLRRTGWTVPVTGVAVAALGHVWTGLSQWQQAPAEAYSSALAAALMAVLGAGAADGWSTWRRVPVAGAAVVAGASWVVGVFSPQWSAEEGLRVLWATVFTGLLLVLVWHRPVLAWAVATAGLFLPLWVWAVWIWERPPQPVELLTVPVALAAGCSAGLAARAAGAPVRGWALRTVLWTLVVPSLVLVVQAPFPQSTVEAARLLGVAALLALVAVLADRASPPDSTLAATLLVGLALLLAVRGAASAGLPLEAYVLAVAAAVSLIGGWLLRPRDAAHWWRWGRWPVLGALVVSSLWAITGDRLPGDGWYEPVRTAFLLGAWIVAAQWNWSGNPWLAAIFGSAAVVIASANAVSLLLAGRADAPLEFVTWSLAAALGVVTWLVWRAAGRRGPSLLWVGPPAALALLPTAAQAWTGGTAGWRAWFGLLLGTAVLLLGMRLSWAGLVLPGLLGIALVVVPVLLHWAGDAPLWVPLTIAGAVLFTVGARLEATRREGRRLVDWAVHLR